MSPATSTDRHPDERPPVVVVTGPTASGKTSLAIELALRFGGGIDFYLTETILVSAEASYLMPTGKLDGLDYYSIGLGLQYRF